MSSLGQQDEKIAREILKAVTLFDTNGSAFYLAAWKSDNPEVVRVRLDRISRRAEELIEVLEGEPSS